MKKIFDAIRRFFRSLGEKYEDWKTKRIEAKEQRAKEQHEWDEAHPNAAKARQKIKEAVIYAALIVPIVGVSVLAGIAGVNTNSAPLTTEDRLQKSIDREVRLSNQYDISTEERQEHMRLANDSITALARLKRMNESTTESEVN